MGTAILKGLLTSPSRDDNPSIQYTAWVRSPSSLQRLRNELGNDHQNVNTTSGGDMVEATAKADIVIFGFPPGELDPVLETKELVNTLRGKLIISLLAGISSDALAQALHLKPKSEHTNIFRVIPSIGAKIHNSVTLIAETALSG